MAFKNKVIGGLGISYVYADFSVDRENGDIKIKDISPFDVKFDAMMRELDLSDCRFIIHEGRLDKSEVKGRFKEYSEEIDGLEPGDSKANYSSEPQTTDKKGRGLLVTEHWFREQYDQRAYYDTDKRETVEFYGDEAEEAVLAESRGYEFFDIKKAKIRLQILVEDKVLVYDGENPYDIDLYPFVFNFGYFDPAIGEWEMRLCGDVDRSLKDINKEKNKRRSQMSAIAAKSPHTGFFLEEGSIEDENKLEKTGGAAKLIRYRRGSQAPIPITPLQIPQGLIQLEEMTTGDQYMAGMNAEMLGQMGERGAPLGLHQMRQSQALMAVQEQFDNHGIYIKHVGNIMIKLITKHFSRDKIVRIVGSDLPFEDQKKEIKAQIMQLERFVPQNAEETAKFHEQVQQLKIQMIQIEEEEGNFWEAWDSLKDNARYDIQVDDTTNSTTYRLAVEQMAFQLSQNGGGFPPDILLEISSLPKSLKDKVVASYRQQQEQQQAMLRQEQQIKIMKMNQEMEIEKMNAMAGMSGVLMKSQENRQQ